MKVVTWLGSTAAIVPITAVIAIALACCQRWRLVTFLVVRSTGGWLLGHVAKQVLGRERPPLPLRLEHPGGSAFPSGHATQAAATYLAIAFVAAALSGTRATRLAACAAAIAIAVAVGISRVYLGVHWATDVMAGWLLGTIWVVGAQVGFGRTLDAPPRAASRAT